MSEKEPEQIMRELFELLRELEKCKVKVERPVPIVRDRQGRLAEKFTIKEWLSKINEEVDELKAEVMRAPYFMESTPGRTKGTLSPRSVQLIVGELCDVIEVLYSMANQMGIDGDMIQQGIYDTNKKLKERGYID